MNQSVRHIIAVSLGIVILGIGIYGNYLPWRKSVAYVSASQKAASAKSLDDLRKVIAPALELSSPIGQPELVRNLANSLMSVVRSTDNPELIDASLKFLAEYYNPIIEKGSGMSFGQDLYIVGVIHEISAIQSKNPVYLDVAERAFLSGTEASPNRPQYLYGLMDVYRFKRDGDRFKSVADKILENWPEDEKTRKLVEDLVIVVPKNGK